MRKFDVGDKVKVIKGPFMNFSGVIEEIELRQAKVRVNVNVFGRKTFVEMDSQQVQKV